MAALPHFPQAIVLHFAYILLCKMFSKMLTPMGAFCVAFHFETFYEQKSLFARKMFQNALAPIAHRAHGFTDSDAVGIMLSKEDCVEHHKLKVNCLALWNILFTKCTYCFLLAKNTAQTSWSNGLIFDFIKSKFYFCLNQK